MAAPRSKVKQKDGEISASVEETNTLRASLGLRPLDTPESSKATEAPQPPKPGTEGKPTDDEVRSRIAAAKTKREHEELTKGKGLADIIKEEEGNASAADWVQRSRDSAGAKSSKRRSAPEESKRSKDLAEPLKVRHDAAALPEGETVVMTLSDKSILGPDGEIDNKPDELSNVRMLDLERAKHHEDIRQQVEYDPTKQGADILDKYDDLKSGPKGFMLGGHVIGVVEEQDPEKRLAILTELSEKQSVESFKTQTDYYTSEEMAKFKKQQKKVKKRQRPERDAEMPSGLSTMVMQERPPDAGSDDEDPELYEQLSKQRRLVRRSDAGAVKKGESALEAVSERIAQVEANDDAEEKEKTIVGNKGKVDNPIAMTATTEFCNVVQTPLEKMETLKHESFRGSTLYKQQATSRRVKAGALGSKRQAMAFDAEDTRGFSKPEEEEETPLTEEALDMSAASGLAYLRARAQISCDQDSHRNRRGENRPLEMSTVDGDIKLEYRDDFGRVQTPKEAFRAISWKFHGKMPGRKNMERRILRLENEMRLKSMNPVEQLPTLRALRHVQRGDAKPYMVLSGANEK